MAEWIAFFVVCVLAAYASFAAVVGLMAYAAFSAERSGWLMCLIPALIAALLIYVATDIAPFTVQAVNRG